MGAFFLYHKNTQIQDSSVEHLYAKKGFTKPFSILIGNYYLKLYKKQLIDTDNYYQIKENYIFTCGSLFYKGLSFRQSLKKLLEDLIHNSIDTQRLYGNYAFIFYNNTNNEIKFYVDPSFVKNVYFDPNKRIITSDFLALVEASPNTYTLNKLAIIENMITGHLISPETYANEIQKLDKVNVSLIEKYFYGIHTIILKPTIVDNICNFDDAINHANEQLQIYFKSVSNLTDEFGANIGLTGGFDSRLLLMHARCNIKRLITSSFWRPNSIEYINAKELAKVADLDFFSFEEEPFQKPSKEEMIRKAFYFHDGQIRSQNNWDEEFNIPEYTEEIASNHFVGFHGCGGEQYRNADRLMRRISFTSFVLYEWMFKQCEDVFIDNQLKSHIYNNIENKIKKHIDIPNNKVGLLELKKIQNEIWNTANRTTRVNVINQQQFYFAPFTEYQLSKAAYYYVPFLGKSLSFQMEMMKRADPELSAVKTNYNFNILKGEPLKFKIIPYVVNSIPRSLFYSTYRIIKSTRITKIPLQEILTVSNPFFQEMENKINFKKLSRNINLGNSLNSFNFLLDQIKLS